MPAHSANATTEPADRRRSVLSSASPPAAVRNTTRLYIRVSVAKYSANGEVRYSTTATCAARAPTTRRASRYSGAAAARFTNADRARTADVPVPNSSIQPCNSR